MYNININPYIIILVVLILIPITKRGYDYLYLNRHFLPNRIIQDKMEPLVKQALEEYGLGDYDSSEYMNINIIQKEDYEIIELELFIIKKWFEPKDGYNKKWNTIEKLIVIKGIKRGDVYTVTYLSEVGSKDLGKIIATPSQKFQNHLFRCRDAACQKKYWPYFKKDWSIGWMDKII